MSVIETADRLLELMFKWIRESEACARELEKMAAELESLRDKCVCTECAGSTVSVVGAACLLGAGLATFFTGGAAAPFLALAGAACTEIGATISITSKLIEHFSSSDTMKEAQRKEQKSNTIEKKIERQFQQLKRELKKLRPQMGPDDLDQHVMTAFMAAVGRRGGNRRVISFLKDMSFDFGGGRLRNMIFPDPGSRSWFSVEMLGVADVLTFFAFQLSGGKNKFLFDKAAERLVKMMSSTIFETVLEGGAMAVGGAVGLVFALPEAIDSWKEMIKNNHVTEASQSLRDTASDILRMTRKLKEQLDNIRKELERLADVKRCIENTDRSDEDQRTLIEYAIENSNDEFVRQWLMDKSSQNVFFRLVDMFVYLEKQLIEEGSRKKINIDDIHITFVAHGAIQKTSILANCLLPLPSIKDVLLYSPWNCLLTADAAYGIATGRIQPEHRIFDPLHHTPGHLPPYWNSMRSSTGQMIPVINVSSITPGDPAWNEFLIFQSNFGEPSHRVVLPFCLPLKVEVPFFIVTLALSLVLLFSQTRATVHLAACLGKASSRTCLNVWQLMAQYAYTEDRTVMTTSEVMLQQRFNNLYRALKTVFDKTPAPRSWF
ncbi:uncharacterized protein V6R79_014932 [Siganus canaliculatus]